MSTVHDRGARQPYSARELPPGVFDAEETGASTCEADDGSEVERPRVAWYVADKRISKDLAAVSPEHWETWRRDLEERRAEMRACVKADRRANRVLTCTNITGAQEVGGGRGGCGVRRRGRADRGARRPPNPQPHPTHRACYVGADKLSRGRFIVVPRGVTEALPLLPEYSLEVFEAAALDIIRRLTAVAQRGPEYVRWRATDQRKRYGQTTVNGRRIWVWDAVRDHLLGRRLPGMPELAPIIETEDGGSYEVDKRSIAYRLREEWRERPRQRLKVGESIYHRRPQAEVPRRADGTSLSWSPWLDECLLKRTRFDFEAGIREICRRAGAECPANTYDFDALEASYEAALKNSTQPREVLEEAELWRKSDDTRSPGEIVRDQAQGQTTHLFAWLVDAGDDPWLPVRDHAGHRLHTPITCTAEYLRKYIELDGEPVVSVDAVNSQMVFLADRALAALNTDDARDFAQVCAEGRFYEIAFELIHGRDFADPQERQRFKSKIMGAWLFVDAGVQHGSKEGQALARRWPNVHLWMLAQKVKGTSTLPCDCQQREAAVWIDTIAPRLAALKLPCLTVHDSVLVPRSRAAEARAVVEQVYAEKGLRAKFKGGAGKCKKMRSPLPALVTVAPVGCHGPDPRELTCRNYSLSASAPIIKQNGRCDTLGAARAASW